jgi:3-dehydroquinate synthase
MRTFDVELGERSYPIHIGAGVLRDAGRLLAPQLPAPRVIIVSSPVIATHWLAPLRENLGAARIAAETLLVPDGEAHKSWQTADHMLTRLLELRADRSTTIVALGGGVVGDLAGFVAAIYQRGVPFVQVPTTLLAQVDSSVGGKTGVNHPLGKNMIGAFHQPRAVLIDTDCLATPRIARFCAGSPKSSNTARFASAHSSNGSKRTWTRSSRESATLAHAVSESCRIKAEVAASDERESGARALLNFGHTFGHAIEAAAGYGEWLHGEAVAAGMVLAAELSRRVSGIAASDASRIEHLLGRARLPQKPPPIPVTRWLELMGRDKKTTGGVLRFVLLEALGRAIVRTGVDEPRCAG